jgi:hypothetical protein
MIMEYIKKTNVPMLLLCLVSVRMLFSDASFALALFGLALTGLFAYSNYLKTKEVRPLDQEVRDQLNEMRSTISSIAVKNNMKAPLKEGQRYF